MWSLLVLFGVFISNLTYAFVFFPVCASNCYETALTSYGCDSFDTACYCKPPAATKYVDCVQGDCDQSGLQQFIAWGQQECAAVGVTFAASAAGASASRIATATETSRPLPTDFALASGVVTASSASSTATVLPVLPTPVAHSGGGLSAGAKAGIGAGVALGSVLILGLLLILLFRERRKRDIALQLQQPQQPPPPLPPSQQPVSYPATSQKPGSLTRMTSTTIASDGSGGEKTSSAIWTTRDTKITSATEYELKGDEPAPHQHDLESGHGEPQSTVL